MDDGDFASRRSFLAEMEPYFERNEVQTALNLALSRLKKMPEDLSSRIVICRAWLIQGRIDEAREILAGAFEKSALEESAREESAGVEEYDSNDEAEGSAEMPPGFETVTLADLYMKQGHYQTAQDLLVKIINRDATNDSAARLLKDVRDRLAQGQNHLMNEEIVKELSRWLDNMGSLRRNA